MGLRWPLNLVEKPLKLLPTRATPPPCTSITRSDLSNNAATPSICACATDPAPAACVRNDKRGTTKYTKHTKGKMNQMCVRSCRNSRVLLCLGEKWDCAIVLNFVCSVYFVVLLRLLWWFEMTMRGC